MTLAAAPARNRHDLFMKYRGAIGDGQSLPAFAWIKKPLPSFFAGSGESITISATVSSPQRRGSVLEAVGIDVASTASEYPYFIRSYPPTKLETLYRLQNPGTPTPVFCFTPSELFGYQFSAFIDVELEDKISASAIDSPFRISYATTAIFGHIYPRLGCSSVLHFERSGQGLHQNFRSSSFLYIFFSITPRLSLFYPYF